MSDKIPEELNLPEKLLKVLSQFNSFVQTTFSTDTDADVPQDDPTALHAGYLGDLASQLSRLPQDLQLGLQLLDVKNAAGLANDKEYMLENIIKFAASLPSDSPSLQLLSSKMIDLLWTNLQHPPLSYIGDEWRYRTANGSNNNRMYPHLGKAGSPYARTVNPVTQLSPTLPDPEVLFDELFARGKTAREHPNKISSMLFYVATIIIHDCFRTNSKDWNIVDNSSYLDLSPLYGNSDDEVKSVRTMKDGKLKPDVFAEVRLAGFPPGVSALLILFNRFHNYIATELAEINESGRFTLMNEKMMSDIQKEKYKTPEAKRDNDLFQTARLITCGLYINVVLIDYVRTILNLNHSHSEWSLDPRIGSADKAFGPSGTPEGVGNQVSVEFNLVYRWHSAISSRDEKWTIDLFKHNFPGLDPEKASVEEMKMAFFSFLGKTYETPPEKRDLDMGRYKRQSDGTFKDEDLVAILRDSTEDVAGAFGARNVPTVMKAIEVLGMKQARMWNVATLNEFRKYFGLEPHKSFSDISSDVGVARSLEALYGDPSLVELYPGLVAEDAKEPQFPGSGLCPGFTISKAILSDAVALVRGDRFYTVDYNAATLTNWGFNQASSDKQIAGGGVIYKLFMRGLPGWYRTGSVYAMFPLTVPQETQRILKQLGTDQDYDFTKPQLVPQPPEVSTWRATVAILNDPKNFGVPWGPHTRYMTGHDYMLSGDSAANLAQHEFVSNALYSPRRRGMEEIRELYEKVTLKLLYEKCHKLRRGFQIDAVADIANLSHAIAVGELFHIPLKLPDEPIGILTPHAFYTIMAVLFAYVFLDFDGASSFKLRAGAKQSADALGKIVHTSVSLVQNAWFSQLKQLLGRNVSTGDLAAHYGTKLIQRLSADGKSADEVTWTMIPTMAAAVATQAQGFSQMLDLLLSDDYIHHWDHIRELARSDDPEAYETLEKYALECYRLATPAFGLLRTVNPSTVEITDGTNVLKAKKDDQIFVNFVKAGVDPDVFPDPYKIKLDRDPATYIHHGHGTHRCIGRDITVTAMAAQLKVFGKLKNLRRAPGLQGELKSKTVNGAFKVYMKPDWSDYWPFPTTMKVFFDTIE